MPPLFRTIVATLLLAACSSSAAFAQASPAENSSASPGSLRLTPRAASDAGNQSSGESGLPSLVSVFGSLGAVLGAFFVLAWFMKRGMPKNMGMLPTEVIEVLGRAPLAQRQHVHLVRCGSRLLLVSVSPAGAETLSEITDPVEVDRLTGICAQHRGDSVTASFRQVLNQFGKSKAADLSELGEPTPEGGQLNGPHSRRTAGEGLHA